MPFTLHLPERAFTKPLAKALVEQRRNLALDARVRSQVITAVDALTLGPDKFRTEAGIYLGLRSIFWSLVRAKSDDDLREVAARLWSMDALAVTDGAVTIGYIIERDSAFFAFDAHGVLIGEYATRTQAVRSIPVVR